MSRQDTPDQPRSARRWIAPVAIAVVAALIVTGILLVRRGASRYYIYQPGNAPLIVAEQSCKPAHSGALALPGGDPCARLEVPAGRQHAIAGQLHMVDVLVGRASWGQYALHKVGLLTTLEPGSQLVPAEEVLGSQPASQFVCQSTQQAVSATEMASVAAVRRLGYHVTQNNVGAQVDTVSPNTAASAAGVECNDLITALNGHEVHTAQDLVSALASTSPGEKVAVTVRRRGTGGHMETLTLHPTLTGTPALDGQPAQSHRAFLGVAAESRVTYTLPFSIRIDVGDIGGPSAGLALTLGLLDTLTNGQLTGGHKIAATGTMDVDGNVGDVGGVAQKTVAVRRAGVQLFLVPPQELKVAESEAGPHMKVEAVTTLDQALADLKAFGGDTSALPALDPAH